MFVGLFLTIILIIAVGVWAGRKATSAESFATGGGTASSWIVCGTLMGTIISGQATVGTAQLAFSFGLSAWWFTIGAAIGILLLGVQFVRPLRSSGCVTLMEIISREYGKRVETIGSCLCVIGIFISIMAQIIASSALFSTIFPRVSFVWSALLSMALMIVYVVFGGLWGAGLGGIVKTVLIYASAAVAGITVWHWSGGYAGLLNDITLMHTDTPLTEIVRYVDDQQIHQQYSNLVARGPLKDIGSCLSLVLGVLSTQTYAQAIWAGKSNKAARRGALWSAALVPPVGFACTLVGMFMRAHYVTAAEYEAIQAAGLTLPQGIGILQNSVQAFPVFVTHHLPKFFGGVVLGTLFITIIGGGSGLTLGATTILVRDLFRPVAQRLHLKLQVDKSLWIQRLTIVATLVLAVLISTTINGSFINDLGFLSLGLRATAVLVPLLCAIYLPRRIKHSFMSISIVMGTLTLLLAKAFRLPGDPVFWGMGICIVVAVIGLLCSKGQNTKV